MPDRPDDFFPDFSSPELSSSDEEELWLAWLPPDFNKPPVKDFPPSEFTENGVEIRRYFNRPGRDQSPAPIYSPAQSALPPEDATRPHDITQKLDVPPARLPAEESLSAAPESLPDEPDSPEWLEPAGSQEELEDHWTAEPAEPDWTASARHIDAEPADEIAPPAPSDTLPIQSMLDVDTDDLPVIQMRSAESSAPVAPPRKPQAIPLAAVMIALGIGLLLMAASLMFWEDLTGVSIGIGPRLEFALPASQPTRLPANSSGESAQPTLTPTGVNLITPLAQNGSAPPPTLAAPTATPDIHFVAGKFVQGNVVMISLAGGTFQMGSSSRDAESPIHSVTVSAYYIDQTEVTIAAWQACVDAGACPLPGSLADYDITQRGNYPVTSISWHNASAYCGWRGARLPTESEWEMAAHWNPDTGAVLEYPWGDAWDYLRLNYCDSSCAAGDASLIDTSFNDGWPQAAPVASFASGVSPSGVFDMAGNVAEWVADWFSPAYYSISPGWNPQGPLEGALKGVRGGSWNLTPADARAAARMSADPATQSAGIGFRCAVSASAIEQP
jgi:formylglycine-generating enzyme required for sulfatase activity